MGASEGLFEDRPKPPEHAARLMPAKANRTILRTMRNATPTFFLVLITSLAPPGSILCTLILTLNFPAYIMIPNRFNNSRLCPQGKQTLFVMQLSRKYSAGFSFQGSQKQLTI